MYSTAALDDLAHDATFVDRVRIFAGSLLGTPATRDPKFVLPLVSYHAQHAAVVLRLTHLHVGVNVERLTEDQLTELGALLDRVQAARAT